jgi:thiol:disulfide interchange protein DsbD
MRSKLKGYSKIAAVFVLMVATSAWAQFRGFQAATVMPPPPVVLTADEAVEASIFVRIRHGYHINSDKPAEQYMIPTRLTWNLESPSTSDVIYPEAELFVSQFSDEALLVYSGEVEFKTKFVVPAKVRSGLTELTGTLRYQACTDKACLAPTSVEFTLPIRSK